MYYLIYISTSIELMGQDDLTSLLAQIRKKNMEMKVTGMLMYSNGTFIQALEGDKKDVDLVYAAIQKDTRHKNLIEIVSGEQETRTFPDWSMAFLTPDPGKMAELDGYINPLHTELFKGDKENTMLNVLKTFADNNNLTHPE